MLRKLLPTNVRRFRLADGKQGLGYYGLGTVKLLCFANCFPRTSVNHVYGGIVGLRKLLPTNVRRCYRADG